MAENTSEAVETVETAAGTVETVDVTELKVVDANGQELNVPELTQEEKDSVAKLAEEFSITDSAAVLEYGASCQNKIAEFSDNTLESIKTKDLGETGEMITKLVTQLKGFTPEEEKKGFLGLFKKAGTSLERMKTQYASVESNVDGIVDVLENHQNQLNKDVVMLDKMYDTNLAYFRELTVYIEAGKQIAQKAKDGELKALQEKAQQTGLTEDAQKAQDYAALVERFEKKLYDLQLTRNISLQMGPQIRLIQNSNVMMSERIQSTVVNTIPLWKNQMVLALGMAHSQAAMQAQKEVTDLTNELLKKNAETLKTGSVEIAQQAERGVVDIETLKETNQKLIESLDEVVRIQAEGREKRAAAEGELASIETQLRGKLMELSKGVNAEN